MLRERAIQTSKAGRLAFDCLDVFIAAGAKQNFCFGLLLYPLPDRILKCLPGRGHTVVLFVFHIHDAK